MSGQGSAIIALQLAFYARVQPNCRNSKLRSSQLIWHSAGRADAAALAAFQIGGTFFIQGAGTCNNVVGKEDVNYSTVP